MHYFEKMPSRQRVLANTGCNNIFFHNYSSVVGVFFLFMYTACGTHVHRYDMYASSVNRMWALLASFLCVLGRDNSL